MLIEGQAEGNLEEQRDRVQKKNLVIESHSRYKMQSTIHLETTRKSPKMIRKELLNLFLKNIRTNAILVFPKDEVII
jgi:hypothetical protein